jgi:hypothetical protein
MANLEGWHIDPRDRRQFRYHDGTNFTEHTTTDVSVVTLPLGLFGKRFFSVKAELVPLLLGIMAVLGWLFWYLAGVIFGAVGLWFGMSFLRIGRTGLLISGVVLAGLGLLLSLGFWVVSVVLAFV